MIPVPSRTELFAALAIVGAIQLAAAFRFRRLWRSYPETGSEPSVTVVAAVAGLDEGIEDRLIRFRNLDYSGSVRFLFATPSEDHPVTRRLREAAAAAGLPAEVAGSGRAPEKASGKIVDLLAAMERFPPRSEVLVFVDMDLGVSHGWLRSLVRPLTADPGIGVTTAAMLYVPASTGLANWTRFLWMVWGMPFFALSGGVTGQSFAMRAADFDSLGLKALWSESLFEDLALARRARSWDKRVRFVPEAVPSARDGAGWREVFSVFNKWMVAYRVYDPRTWILGLALTAFKAYALTRCFSRGFDPALLAAWWGVDAAYLALLAGTLAARLPDRFGEDLPGPFPLALASALLSPLLQPVYAVNLAGSFSSRIRWGARTYRLRGPRSVEVLDRAG